MPSRGCARGTFGDSPVDLACCEPTASRRPESRTWAKNAITIGTSDTTASRSRRAALAGTGGVFPSGVATAADATAPTAAASASRDSASRSRARHAAHARRWRSRWHSAAEHVV